MYISQPLSRESSLKILSWTKDCLWLLLTRGKQLKEGRRNAMTQREGGGWINTKRGSVENRSGINVFTFLHLSADICQHVHSLSDAHY
jgi:hypothetical protein